MRRAVLLAGLVLCLPTASVAVPDRPYEVTEERADCADFDALRRPFFGDTHVHTAYSFDARAQDTRNTPRDAYRFAKGAPMGIQPYDEKGEPTRTIRIDRPLDWTMLSDHAEFLGEVRICRTPGTWSYWHPVCIAHRNSDSGNKFMLAAYGLVLKRRWGICGDENQSCFDTARDVWSEIRDAAEEAYDRSEACAFTSFVGYEWTASVGEGSNLHRNVVFRNDQVPDLPVSWIETPSAMDLWSHLQEECVDGIEGCDALTIPHNSNLSGGLMFQTAKVSEDAIPGAVDREEAKLRSRWEPLVEMMQHKGDSECDPLAGSIWADDEACGFEKLHYDRFGATQSSWATWQQAAPSNFVRDALKQGLRYEGELGANPLKYGVIASTDTHIAAPGLVAEKNHPGHGGAGKGGGAEAADEFPDDFEFSPGGLAVLWAEENTRDSLFAAMQRREAYGTSGTRPVVRFFGGWDYPDTLCTDPLLVAKGYAGGVPMGGDLSAPPDGEARAPRFVAWAAQDPGTWDGETTPLQRIQIVKGWVDGRELHERVIDVAGGPNGAGVDLATCERRGEGAQNLCSVWTDPDFDPLQRAFYYVRVLENPTCRWSQYFCNEQNVDCGDPASIPEGLAKCCAEEHRPVIQERAWTSPIWYSPAS
ncbi:MAG: DUF3604 domain-containing protein [Candidatus Binatia bacterium]|nr:DUF3604 domain-containing protein [Candidatus Binatia bacterium]